MHSTSWILLSCVVAALVCADSSRAVHIRPPGVTRRVRRQAETATPTPGATTYDYWWPYPPWSATAIVIPAPTIAVGATATMGAVAPVNTGAALASTATPGTSPTVSLSSDPVLPASASPTLIQITALPPATTTTRSAFHQTKHSSFDIAYLAPLFGVFAAVLGTLCGWAAFVWYARRQEGRPVKWGSSTLLPGPRYASPPETGEDRSAYEYRGSSVNQESLRPEMAEVGRETPSGQSSRPASTVSKGLPVSETGRDESWFVRAFSTRNGRTGAASFRKSDTIPEPAVYEHVPEDEESIIATPQPVARGDSAASGRTRVTSAGACSDDEDEANVPYDTLHHKSIRRSLLDRLKVGSLRRLQLVSQPEPSIATASLKSSMHHRPGHQRKDSDYVIQAVTASGSGSASSSTPQRTRFDASAFELDSPGFCILEEDTEAGTLRPSTIMLVKPHQTPRWDSGDKEEPEGWNWMLSWSRSNHENGRDNFTALPTRLSEKRTPGLSPVRQSSSYRQEHGQKYEQRRYPRIDSSVLPRSPPQLMSPPLEHELFLSPRSVALPTFGSVPNLNLRALPGASPPRDEVRVGDGSPRRKLKSPREPPLPFPTSGSPFKAKLKKSLRCVRSPPVEAAEGDPTNESLLASPRHPAHDKVDEILLRGFAQRSASMLSFAHAGASIDHTLAAMG